MKEMEARLFSMMSTDRTRDSGCKVKYMKFPVNTRKHFFTVRLAKHCHKNLALPRLCGVSILGDT